MTGNTAPKLQTVLVVVLFLLALPGAIYIAALMTGLIQ